MRLQMKKLIRYLEVHNAFAFSDFRCHCYKVIFSTFSKLSSGCNANNIPRRWEQNRECGATMTDYNGSQLPTCCNFYILLRLTRRAKIKRGAGSVVASWQVIFYLPKVGGVIAKTCVENLFLKQGLSPSQKFFRTIQFIRKQSLRIKG